MPSIWQNQQVEWHLIRTWKGYAEKAMQMFLRDYEYFLFWENVNRYSSWQLSLNFWKPPTSLENFLQVLFCDAIFSFPVQFVQQLIAQFRKTKLTNTINSFCLKLIMLVKDERQYFTFMNDNNCMDSRPHRKLQ